MTITLRADKGSALTHDELDANFTTIDQDTVDALIAALRLSVVPVNLVQVRGQSIGGTGSESDPWRPV